MRHAIREPYAGGLEAHTHLLARGLKARGHEVVVFAAKGSDASMRTSPIGAETSSLPQQTGDVPFLHEHAAYLDMMLHLDAGMFDVIHNNSLHYLPLAMADMITAPMVTTLHTPPFCWLESGIRLCQAKHTSFVAVSDAIREMWSAIVPIEHTVPNGIDLGHFPYRAVPNDPPFLIWYGRIVPEKGLHLAIAAARKTGLALQIAGPVSDPDYFAAEIAPLLGGGVDYIGHLDHAALSRLIGSASAALCTPMWEEPYGLVVAEALACGTPVAAFARGAIPTIIDAKSGTLAVPDDPGSLSAAVLAAIGLDRAACRSRAESICDLAVMIDGYEAIYAARLEASSTQRGAGLALTLRPGRTFGQIQPSDGADPRAVETFPDLPVAIGRS